MRSLFLLLLASQLAYAQPPPEEVVTPDSTAESSQNQEPSYPHITTRGQLQFQFDDGARGAASGDDPAAVLNGIGRFRVADQLDIRRGRLVTNLHLSPDLLISNESNFDTRTNAVSVLDMYMRAQLSENLNFRAGLFKIPFGWEGQRSSRTTNTIEMSDVTRALSNFRDSGFALGLEEENWSLTVAAVQGQGGVWTDRNAGKDFVARLTYNLTPEWLIGASTHIGSFRPDNSGLDIPVRRFGFETQYQSGPWKIEGEYITSRGYNFISRRDTQANGFYLCVVRQLDERNDILVHFDRFEPDLLKDSNTRNRLVLGWNYYFQRSPEHRIMVNYEFAQEEEGPRVSNNGWRIRYQYAW